MPLAQPSELQIQVYVRWPRWLDPDQRAFRRLSGMTEIGPARVRLRSLGSAVACRLASATRCQSV